MPAVQPISETHLILSHLLIPAGPPVFALRRILHELLVGMRPNLDQAALQSLLRRLYSLGLPLISVNRVDVEE